MTCATFTLNPMPLLRGAPAFSRDREYDWTDRAREQELHDYYGARYYWGGP